MVHNGFRADKQIISILNRTEKKFQMASVLSSTKPFDPGNRKKLSRQKKHSQPFQQMSSTLYRPRRGDQLVQILLEKVYVEQVYVEN